MSDPGYPTVAPPSLPTTTTIEPLPPVTTTSDPPPAVTTTTNPPPVTTTDPPPPVTTITTTNPPPQTTTTTKPDATTNPTTNRPPPVTTTVTENKPPETTVTTPPYTTQYITTVSVVTITTLVPHTTTISGSVTIIYATETTTSLQPTIIQDPRQPPPPLSTYANRNGFHPWQIGFVVALILVLLALCLAAVVLIWFRKRRQELRDQEDKVVGSREPWNDPATAAAVMGPSSGGGGGGDAGAAGVMHPGWHEYNKEAGLMAAAVGDSRVMSSMDGGYHHVYHHHPDTRYGPNGELMLIGYADPYGGGGGEDTTDYLGGQGRAFSGSDDYGLGLDYAMSSEISGGAELASYSGSLAGDHLSYSGSNRYPIPPPLQQQHVSSNHPQESQPASPVPRASYEDEYHATVALRQQLQQQQQQQSRVFYPQPPWTATSAAATSRQPSKDELGTATSGTTEVIEEGPADDYRLNLEKYSKVENRRQSPHALLIFGHQAGDQDGEIGGEAAGPGGIVASPLEGPIPNAITGEGAGESGKEGGLRRDDLTSESGSSSGRGGDGDGGDSHERGPSTPGEETAAVRSYLDRLRIDT